MSSGCTRSEPGRQGLTLAEIGRRLAATESAAPVELEKTAWWSYRVAPEVLVYVRAETAPGVCGSSSGRCRAWPSASRPTPTERSRSIQPNLETLPFEVVDTATQQPLQLVMQELWLAGRILPVGADLRVRHLFRCGGMRPVEAIYTFALPRDAALRRFEIRGADFSVNSDLRATRADRAESGREGRTPNRAARRLDSTSPQGPPDRPENVLGHVLTHPGGMS